MNTQKYLNSFVEEHKMINSPQFDNSATRERIDALTETKNQLRQEFTPMMLGQFEYEQNENNKWIKTALKP